MPPAQSSKQPQGVLDGLKTVFTDVAQLQLSPDAAQHMQFLQGLQQAIVKYSQQQQQQKAQQAAQMQQQQAQAMANPQMGGPPPGGMPPGAGMGGPPRPPQGQPGGPPSQGSPGIAMPNPDELRRVLAMQGAGGAQGG